ncbi:putative epidermal cell surface receptor isoform X2 [Ischnura elegans]|uniref:putative epidermal cell surface receptor isoform X2 n=1 Tax=Ischnura elegans TaxID=197161 RepID=UPI001ED8A909|nr:putative epidermal cell surface receptor isoform X2 [Ischnura elegans]
MFANKGSLVAAAFLALALTLASPEEICDCEEKPKCPSEAPKDCGGGRGLLMVPGGEECSCCEAVCPRVKGESCEGPHSLACDHGLVCGDAGVCTEESSLMSGAQLTALSATDTSLTLGWKGPPGYVIQYREIEEGGPNKTTETPWKKFEKISEGPEWNLTLTDLKAERSYEARAVLPGPEGADQGRLGEPEAAVRAEVGCACPRPFFRIGTVQGDSGCNERPMAEKPCCVLVVCADSQTSETETPGMVPRVLVNATMNTSTTAAPMVNATEKMGMNNTEMMATEKCTHKNETLSIGEVFHDGCEQKCTCEAGGKVACKPRCEEMPHNISSKCFTIPDPKDVCCTTVLCDVTLGDQDGQESKGSTDAASTTTTPATHNAGKEGCTYNGRTYAYDQEFHDGCRALCICSHDGEVECAPIHCPTDSGLDVLDPHCVTWEPVPMEPGEDEGDSPTCCPEVRCKDNGSCEYAGQHFDNFAEIPASVSEGCSGHRCFCEFGNITCGGGAGVSKCLPLPPHAPANLQCLGGGPGSAILAHPRGDNCCLAWMCPEDAHDNKGSTNSSAEGPVPEVTMIPQVDNMTVSTDNKDQPMTTMTPTITPHESTHVMETMKINATADTMDEHMNITSENSQTSLDSTTSPSSIPTMDNMQNGQIYVSSPSPTTLPPIAVTETMEPMTTMHSSGPDTVEHRGIENTHMTSTLPPPSDSTTASPQTPFLMTHETTTISSSGPETMKPIVLDEKPAYQSPWGNLGGTPEVRIQNKNPKIPGPIQIPEEESSAEEDPYSYWYGGTPDSPKKNETKPHMLVTTPNRHPQIPGPIQVSEEETSAEEDPYSFWYGVHPDSPKKNESKGGIPFTPEYNGPFANKPEEPVPPFKPIHDGRHATAPNSQQKPNENIHKKPKHPDDGLPIFLRYPVQSGKKQRVDPQKSRLPERPTSPNANDFEYQGPFIGVPPSGPDDRIVFHPQGGNIKQAGNFPTRPNGLSKNPGNIYGQQPPPFRQPSSKYPGEHDAFPVPVLIHPGQRPPNQPPRAQGPGNQPLHPGVPISGNAVQHHQGGAHPQEHFQIQDLEGGPVPPEIAQHILWALQGGRPPVGGEQRPPGPQQQGQRVLPPQPPPLRGPPQRFPSPQEVFFQVPSGVGPGNHPTAQNPAVFVPNQELPNYRNPPRIAQTQNRPPHLAQVPPHGPPHFLPGVEPEFLPPELYHLAFGGEHPDENNRTKQETSPPSKTNKSKQPPMTHDHEHLTEDLPLNHPGTDFGHHPPPPPPSRFPEMPLHPHLHPQLHNVGVSSPSDEISVDAANVMPDSSVHLVFSLPSLFVGLHGQVEISYTQDPLKEDPETWEGKEIVSTPGDLIETRRLEYTIPAFNGKTGLQPNKVYRIRIMLLLRDLRNSPSSRIITIHTPSGNQGNQGNATQLPAQIEVDAELGIAEVNSTWARFVWRKFNDFELQFIDGVQLRYKEIEGKVYSTTQLLHRATVSYTLEGLRPSSTYEVSLLLVPFPDQKTELIARETLHITTAAEKDPYGFDLKIKVDNIKVFSTEVSWSGVPYPEDKYVNIFRVIYQSDSAGTKGGEGSEGGPDGEERSSTFKVAKRDPSPSALVTGLKPGTRYRMWLEAYLTNGRIKKSDVKDIVTKPSSSSSTKQGKLEASVGEVGKKSTEESGDYYGGLVGVSILAALAFVAILILLLMLLKRQGQAKKAAISTARKSESAYDNPTYKTSDHDSTNGRIKNSARLQEA